ncbi:MAG: hypothetical protein ACKO96_22290 [Flammeovirgaceae bacterium]
MIDHIKSDLIKTNNKTIANKEVSKPKEIDQEKDLFVKAKMEKSE